MIKILLVLLLLSGCATTPITPYIEYFYDITDGKVTFIPKHLTDIEGGV